MAGEEMWPSPLGGVASHAEGCSRKICPCKVTPQHLDWIETRTLTKPLRKLIWHFEATERQICWSVSGSLCCCVTQVHFSWRFILGAIVVLLESFPLLGSFTTLPSVLRLRITAQIVACWVPKALGMALEPFPDWESNYLFSPSDKTTI